LAHNKRDDILQAALELFAERQYDGTTVPMIADKAQVGAGTIYRYFESKEVLVNELFQDCVKDLSDRLTAPVPVDLPEVARVRGGADRRAPLPGLAQ